MNGVVYTCITKKIHQTLRRVFKVLGFDIVRVMKYNGLSTVFVLVHIFADLLRKLTIHLSQPTK